MNSAMLRTKLRIDAARVRAELKRDLQALARNIEDAIGSIDEGKRLPPRLVVNEAMITASIAEWNLLREIVPCLEGPHDEDAQ